MYGTVPVPYVECLSVFLHLQWESRALSLHIHWGGGRLSLDSLHLHCGGGSFSHLCVNNTAFWQYS